MKIGSLFFEDDRKANMGTMHIRDDGKCIKMKKPRIWLKIASYAIAIIAPMSRAFAIGAGTACFAHLTLNAVILSSILCFAIYTIFNVSAAVYSVKCTV